VKILIELPTWLGDTVMVTPAIENIVNFYNDVEITFIGSFVSIEALKNYPKVIKTLVLEKKYTSLYRTAKDLGKFDVFFSFRGSFRTKFLKFLIPAKKKYQFDKNKYQNRHQVEKYNDFINDSLDIEIKPGKLKLYTQCQHQPEDESTSVEREVSTISYKLTVGLNPGASYGSAKRWYPQEFAKVASELSSEYDIVIFGGSSETDIAGDIGRALIDSGVKNYKNLAGNTTITELINKIASLDLFITGDSGPMHIAAAFQVPTVAIFGPTKDKETSQWMNKKSIIVKKNLDCQPCMERTCPLQHHNCMNLIKAVDVLNAVSRIK
jgi:heptosyltransferase-2